MNKSFQKTVASDERYTPKEIIDALGPSTQKESLHIPETCKENPDSFTSKMAAKAYVAYLVLSGKDIEGCTVRPLREVAEKAFIAGAKWQKEQMMKEAVEGEVYRYESYHRIATAIVVDIPRESIDNKVKLIIVKED